jgi:hypothetical protein
MKCCGWTNKRLTVWCKANHPMRSYNIVRPASLLLQGKHVVLLDVVEVLSTVVITRHRLIHRNVDRAQMDSIMLSKSARAELIKLSG